jgi:hypothetical protein
LPSAILQPQSFPRNPQFFAGMHHKNAGGGIRAGDIRIRLAASVSLLVKAHAEAIQAGTGGSAKAGAVLPDPGSEDQGIDAT